jgi:nitrate reductase gamma subunit
MGILLIIAAYAVYAVFCIRFFLHAWVWCAAVKEPGINAPPSSAKAVVFALGDMFFFARLLKVNAALWFGEWVFHVCVALVFLRHLRYVLNPVPDLIWCLQMPGLIAGYVLPLSLLYILIFRLFTRQEKYSSQANLLLLTAVLAISSIGVLMHAAYKPDLVGVKLFILGLLSLAPAPAVNSWLFSLHFVLFLALVPFLPTHIFTAPFVMTEARKREQALHQVLHD